MYLLGIDIGGTRIKAGLVDEMGMSVRASAAPTPDNLDAFREALRKLVKRVLKKDVPSAVGFGCKGIIDPETTRVVRLPGAWEFLEGTLLKDWLDGLVPGGTAVTADNDAKAALAGEVVWGAAKGKRNALLLTLGTGVGGAILADGRILRGATGVAGHLGHIVVDPDGPPCICGSHGCLEAVFSSRAIEAEAWSAAHQGVASVMTDWVRQNPGHITCEKVFAYAAEGDEIAQWILKRRVRVLGAALAGLLNAYDPEVVIVMGAVAEAGDQLFEPLRNEVYWRTKGLLRREVPIVPGGLRDSSGVAGAAGLAGHLLFQLAQ
jgi:glucokinase